MSDPLENVPKGVWQPLEGREIKTGLSERHQTALLRLRAMIEKLALENNARLEALKMKQARMRNGGGS